MFILTNDCETNNKNPCEIITIETRHLQNENKNKTTMALSSATLLRPQTVLQQLLEEINFQRAKEMRQMLKDGNRFFG